MSHMGDPGGSTHHTTHTLVRVGMGEGRGGEEEWGVRETCPIWVIQAGPTAPELPPGRRLRSSRSAGRIIACSRPRRLPAPAPPRPPPWPGGGSEGREGREGGRERTGWAMSRRRLIQASPPVINTRTCGRRGIGAPGCQRTASLPGTTNHQPPILCLHAPCPRPGPRPGPCYLC